jgi:hypothetical protein
MQLEMASRLEAYDRCAERNRSALPITRSMPICSFRVRLMGRKDFRQKAA